MNDEPHSHKKATVALVAVLLLAYVGSYLWFREWSALELGGGIRLLSRVEAHQFYPSSKLLDALYWPLRKLDQRATGETVSFTNEGIEANRFR